MTATNWQSFTLWSAKTLTWGWRGAVAGIVIATVVSLVQLGSSSSPGEAFLYVTFTGAAFGAIALGGIPALCAAWFLLLHMVSQLSGAARVPVARRVESEADDDDDDESPVSEPVRRKARPAVPAAPAAPAGEKVCPDCGESVKAAARICRFCRYDFSPDSEG